MLHQGGATWDRVANFYDSMYGVGSLEDSAGRIASMIRQVPEDAVLVMVAHNGPAGLGDQPHDICGVDWRSQGGGEHLPLNSLACVVSKS